MVLVVKNQPTYLHLKQVDIKRRRFNPWVKKIPWRKERHPTPVFLLGKFHGQRSLVGYSPWDHEESDTTKHTQHTHIPFQPTGGYSCPKSCNTTIHDNSIIAYFLKSKAVQYVFLNLRYEVLAVLGSCCCTGFSLTSARG